MLLKSFDCVAREVRLWVKEGLAFLPVICDCVSFVRPPSPPPPSGHCWFHFNDSHVYPVREQELQSTYSGKSSAYMLFYRRIIDQSENGMLTFVVVVIYICMSEVSFLSVWSDAAQYWIHFM